MELKEIYLESNRLANAICNAYILHDQGKLDKAVSYFEEVYSALFPFLPPKRTRKAAESITAALAVKDQFDYGGVDRDKRFSNPRWTEVYNHFLEFCKALGLPESYAYHHTEFWRKHKGERDYWTDCLAAEKIFGEHVIGNKNWISKTRDGRNGPGMLAALFLVAVEGHDTSTKQAWDMTRKAMEQYYHIILASREDKKIEWVARVDTHV